MLHKFELKGKENSMYSDVLIDGNPVEAIGISFSQFVGEVPQAVVYLPSYPDISSVCDVTYMSDEAGIKNAVNYLRKSIMKDAVLYAGFVASIKSALDDIEGSMNHEETAKLILDRIIGID